MKKNNQERRLQAMAKRGAERATSRLIEGKKRHRRHGKRRSRDREKPGAERIAILGLGPGDYRGACLLRQVETMF
jgi:hypothetical protein